MKKKLESVLKYLQEQSGFDFSGGSPAMLERRIVTRYADSESSNLVDYFNFLKTHKDEPGRLVEALTINVSSFFRQPLTYEYIAAVLLPDIVSGKAQTKAGSIRVWSAGCSEGEEAYSIAILVNELIKKEKLSLTPVVFATDINEKVLRKARKAVYAFESIKNIKYELLEKYFTIKNDMFALKPEIKKTVNFVRYDILDRRTYAPPESVFGSFDMVFCCNVLIYFNNEYQKVIFEKFYRSISENGYLVLGEAEGVPVEFQRHFTRVNTCCHVYKKH